MVDARRKGWEQMETLLDKELGSDKKPVYITFLPYAASVLLLLTASLFYYNNYSPNTVNYGNQLDVQPINERVYKDDFISGLEQFSSEKPVNQAQIQSSENAKRVLTVSEIDLDNQFTAQNNLSSSVLPVKDNRINPFLEQGNTENKITEAKSKRNSPTASLQVENKIADQQAKRRTEVKRKNGFVTNQKEKSYELMSALDIQNSFSTPKINLGLQTNGSIGLVSKDMEDFGLRLGFEIKKPLNENLSLNSGIRYSTYKDQYNSTYDVSSAESDHYLVERLSNREVSRRFIELPVYADLSLNENISIKSGFSVTYNNNHSDNSFVSPVAIAGNSSLTDDEKLEAGRLLNDQQGYLGEAVLGASVSVDKITFDVEGTYGIISNQEIDNRNIVGARISYRLGN